MREQHATRETVLRLEDVSPQEVIEGTHGARHCKRSERADLALSEAILVHDGVPLVSEGLRVPETDCELQRVARIAHGTPDPRCGEMRRDSTFAESIAEGGCSHRRRFGP